jgi:hypothetical protein
MQPMLQTRTCQRKPIPKHSRRLWTTMDGGVCVKASALPQMGSELYQAMPWVLGTPNLARGCLLVGNYLEWRLEDVVQRELVPRNPERWKEKKWVGKVDKGEDEIAKWKERR